MCELRERHGGLHDRTHDTDDRAFERDQSSLPSGRPTRDQLSLMRVDRPAKDVVEGVADLIPYLRISEAWQQGAGDSKVSP